jgi:hypothetical protein
MMHIFRRFVERKEAEAAALEREAEREKIKTEQMRVRAFVELCGIAQDLKDDLQAREIVLSSLRSIIQPDVQRKSPHGPR